MTARTKVSTFFVLALVAMMVLPLGADAKKATSMYRMSHFGKFAFNKPIEIGSKLKGVKLETITFSGDEAMVIIWNRNASSVKAHVGVALFDKKNRLMAAQSDSTSMARSITSVRAGKQANFKIKFKKFLKGFYGVAKYQVVLVTEM
ncbi:MAG: hypothetical protein ACE5K1_09570 [Acidiferrobacterales bacterium]